MLESCDARYRDVEGADAAEDLFVHFFVELYIEVLLGEHEDVFGGPVFFMHAGHAYKGGLGHHIQWRPMKLGHKLPRPSGWADYVLEVRNIVRRHGSSCHLVASMQAMAADQIRVQLVRNHIATAQAELAHSQPLFKNVSPEGQQALARVLKEGAAVPAARKARCVVPCCV
ncbi:hypothetical protein JCM10296v2_006538 [Rhodotorula toruloides]